MNRTILDFPGRSLGYLVLMLFGLLAITQASAGPEVSDGKRLFATHCAACHGNGGTGGVGVPLSLPAFINSVDDNYLQSTIRLGRPGRIMPPFSHLSDSEIHQLISYMRSWTGYRPAPYSRKPIAGDRHKGQQLFDRNCASCHGIHGVGGHGTGVTFSRPRNLPILAPALNNSGFLSSASDAMIKSTLVKGRQGTPMISFRSAGLGDQDLNDIVSYIRSFEKTAKENVVDHSEPATLVVESPFSVEKTVENVKQAIVSANMKLIRVEYLDEGFVSKGKEDRKRVIVNACGFNFLNEALKIDPRVGVFLPCRVTVVEQKGKVLVMAVNPKRLAYLFNNNELVALCEKMKKTYTNLMEEATF